MPGPAVDAAGPALVYGASHAVIALDDENLPLFTVGQVSDMLEIQQAFLRRLDEHRVVRPSRSPGGQRRYTRREITVVAVRVDLVDEGMTLAAVRRVLELKPRCARWKRSVTRSARSRRPARGDRRPPGAALGAQRQEP